MIVTNWIVRKVDETGRAGPHGCCPTWLCFSNPSRMACHSWLLEASSQPLRFLRQNHEGMGTWLVPRGNGGV